MYSLFYTDFQNKIPENVEEVANGIDDIFIGGISFGVHGITGLA